MIAIPSKRDEVARILRGKVYLARATLSRLEHAWPDPAKRGQWQQRSIDQARTMLALVEQRAVDEGIDPASVSTFGARLT